MDLKEEIKFWDQVFPCLPYAFQRSHDLMDEFGYDHELTTKSMQRFGRTEKIGQQETRDANNKFGPLGTIRNHQFDMISRTRDNSRNCS